LEDKLVLPAAEDDDDDDSGFGSSDDESIHSPTKAPQKFEGEFNWDGFEEAKQLSEQNAQLLVQMDQKDKEIGRLNVLVRAIEPIPGLDPEKLLDVMQGTEVVDHDYRDTKIVDLAKKNKSLGVELSKAKSAYKRVKEEMDHTKKNLQNTEEELEKLASPAARAAARNAAQSQATKREGGSPPKRSETAAAKQKLADTQVKLDLTQKEMKKMKRLLAREVGDGVDINQISEEDSGFRGRAQQIIMLRTKVKRLEAERAAAMQAATNPNFKSNRNRNDVDLRAAEDLQGMEQQRRDAMEQITMENKQLVEEAAKIQNKFEAAKARTHVLENDNKKQIGQVKTLLDKTTMDDQLVDALREELDKQRKAVRKLKQQKLEQEQTTHSQMVATGALPLSDAERDRYDRQAHGQASRIEAQDRLVSQLRQEISRLRDAGDSMSNPRRPTSQETRTRARQQTKVIEAEKTLAENRALKVEKERLRELSEVLRSKLAEADQDTEELKSALSIAKAKNSQMKRQMGGRQSLKRNDPGSAAALREKLVAMEEENKAIRESFRGALANSEQELELVRRMAAETKQVYERSLAEIQEQLQQEQLATGLSNFNAGLDTLSPNAGRARLRSSGSVGGGGASSPRSQKINSLSADNDSLQRDLQDMKEKYHQLAKKQQLGNQNQRGGRNSNSAR
jgi:hypothetical protein